MTAPTLYRTRRETCAAIWRAMPIAAILIMISRQPGWASCDDSYSVAALHKIDWSWLIPNAVECATHGDNCTSENFAFVEKKAAELKQWASALPSGCVRQAYLDWADYAANNVAEAKAELETHATRKSMTEQLDRIHNAIEAHPNMPEPPR